MPATDAGKVLVVMRTDDVGSPVEVVEVALRVKVAQLDVAEDLEIQSRLRPVGQPQDPELNRAGVVGGVGGTKYSTSARAPDALGGDPGVPGAMTALVAVQVGPHRLPGGTPELARVLPPEVDVAAWLVGGQSVVAVAADPAAARVPVEREAPRGVGDDPPVAALAQVVEPGGRGVRVA